MALEEGVWENRYGTEVFAAEWRSQPYKKQHVILIKNDPFKKNST